MKTTVLTLILAAGLVGVVAAVDSDGPDGPSIVIIAELSHWFEQVEFTHTDHVGMAEDCSSCHHYQEPDEVGRCSDCHAVDYDPGEPDAPNLKMAYHQLCLGCHQAESGPLACIDCHARKALPDGPDLGDGKVR